MFKCSSAAVAALLSLVFALPSHSFARDRDKNFGRGHGGPWRGNEHSQRPNNFQIGQASSGGNGCPAGTMSVVWAPDNLSFSILFDQFVASAAPGQRRDVMSCDALIPVTLPDNMQMEITRVDYRGFIMLPDARAKAKLHALFNFRGRGGDGDRMNLRFDFTGPVTDNYTISSDVLNGGGDAPNPEVSPCGGTTQLRIFNQLVVQAPGRESQAQATIDSIDGQANAVYYVNWRACTGRNNDNDRGGGNGGRGRDGDNDRDGRDRDGRGPGNRRG